MNNSKQMLNIIDDINDSRYKDAEVNEKEVIINDIEILKDRSQTQKQPPRDNAGKKVARLEPMFTGRL